MSIPCKRLTLTLEPAEPGRGVAAELFLGLLAAVASALEPQAERSAWRWTFYKLKLTFEGDMFGFQSKAEALLAGFIGPDGRTFAEVVVPQLPTWNQQGVAMLALPPAGGTTRGS